ncbi:hypothetical protein [Streptomyces viridochromogenes]|nr:MULTISPECIES: hypothetical protein [Streptomyces]
MYAFQSTVPGSRWGAESTRRRHEQASRQVRFGYTHACVAYPLTDVELDV